MFIRGEIKKDGPSKVFVESKNMNFTITFPNKKDFTKYSAFKGVFISFPDDLLKNNNVIYSNSVLICKDLFKKISELSTVSYSNIVGKISMIRPLTQTKGTDSLFSIILEDGSASAEVKFFLSSANAMGYHNKFKTGDCVSITNVKKFNENLSIVFKTFEITELNGNINEYYELVRGFLNQNIKPSLLRNPKKDVLIMHIEEGVFFNVIGRVLHFDSDIQPTISITDYTINERFGSQNTILTIKLYGKHSELMSRLKLGELYYIKNIKIRTMDPFATALMHDLLEGDIIHVTHKNIIAEFQERERNLIAKRGGGLQEHNMNGRDEFMKSNIPNTNIKENFEQYNLLGDVGHSTTNSDSRSESTTRKSSLLSKQHEESSGSSDTPFETRKMEDNMSAKKTFSNSRVVKNYWQREPEFPKSDRSYFTSISNIQKPGVHVLKCCLDSVDWSGDATLRIRENNLFLNLSIRNILKDKILKFSGTIFNKTVVLLVFNIDKKLSGVDVFRNEEELVDFEDKYRIRTTF